MLSRLFGIGDRSGLYDRTTSTMYTEPWAWRNADAQYVGWNGQVWLYRLLPVMPLKWEDPSGRLRGLSPLHSLLLDLGSTSTDPGGGLRVLAREREIHLVSVTSQEEPAPPPGTGELLADYQRDALPGEVPRRRLLIGVRLWASSQSRGKSRRGPLGALKGLAKSMTDDIVSGLGEAVPDLTAFQKDRDDIHLRIERVGGTVPDRQDLNQLESWYNLGRGTVEVFVDTERYLETPQGDRIEMAAVQQFEEEVLQSPGSLWALEAISHTSPASVVSIRAHLQPATVAVNRLRSSERRLVRSIEEEAATGDLSRPEDSRTLSLARQVEDYLSESPQPLLTRCSILFARRERFYEASTYVDVLRDRYGMQVKPVVMRQLEALTETLPTSSVRANPFVQDLFPAFVAHSGIQAGANLGDAKGMFGGLVDPEFAPFYIDPTGAGDKDMPAATAVIGDSGSGKAQPLTAPVLTPAGWRQMGELAAGDEVVGSDGQPTVVREVFEAGERAVWVVETADGHTVECCDEHLWTVLLPDGSLRTATAAALAGDLAAGLPLRLPPARPAQHPWVAGLDAVQVGRRLAVADETAAADGRRLVTARLDQRRAAVSAALAGAAVDRTGALVLDLPDGAPARALADLAGSLGAEAVWADGRLRCRPAAGEPLTRRPAHTAGVRPHRGRRLVRIAPVGGTTPMRCIAVAAPDRLYITGGFMPTHNTWMCQSLATQAALDGRAVVFINPKGLGTLSPMVDLLNSKGVPARLVRMTDLEQSDGFFDPCRYAPTPGMAAEIASGHILSVLQGMSESEELDLEEGIRRGIVEEGARCVGEALEFVADPQIVDRVRRQMATSSLFSLGAGSAPQPRFNAQSGLTLIEFDRALELPEQGVSATTRTQRIHLAAMRIVTRAALEILASGGGGILVVDEAWTFLGHPQGLNALQQLGRMGRSQGLLPIFATQRLADLRSAELESYFSRFFALRLTDQREATAALNMLGLTASEGRLGWLAQAGSKRPDDGEGPGRPAMALHRDLEGQVSAVLLGPTPRDAAAAFSTNLADRRRQTQDSQPDALPDGAAGQGTAQVGEWATPVERTPAAALTEGDRQGDGEASDTSHSLTAPADTPPSGALTGGHRQPASSSAAMLAEHDPAPLRAPQPAASAAAPADAPAEAPAEAAGQPAAPPDDDGDGGLLQPSGTPDARPVPEPPGAGWRQPQVGEDSVRRHGDTDDMPRGWRGPKPDPDGA